MGKRSKILVGAAVAAVITAGAGTAAVAIAGTGGPDGHRSGARMMDSEMRDARATGSERMGSERMGSGRMGSAGVHVDSERGYLSEMIPHHEEAIAAAEQLLARSDRAEMKAFATSIVETQSAQIEQMKAELARAGIRAATRRSTTRR